MPRTRGARVSARWRIVGWILLTTGLTLLAVILTMRSLLTADVERAANTAISQELEEFARFASEGVDPRTGQPFEHVDDLLELYLSRQHPDQGEALVGIAGQTVLYSDNTRLQGPDGPYRLGDDAALLERITSSAAPSGVLDTAHGELRWGRVTVQTRDEPGTFLVAEFVGEALRQTQHVLRTTVLVALGGLALTALIAWFVAGQILAPVRSIARTAARISETDLSVRVPVVRRDDLGELAASFNGMLDRIEEAYTAQRRFVDDASHELRTPITVIRGHLELIGDDPAERAETLAVVDTELARMSRIVTDLLLLAKAERPDFLQRRPTDLEDLMLHVDSTVQALDDRPWLLMEVAEGTAEVDPQRLTQAMLQYAANAVQYSPAGSPVRFGSTLVRTDEGTHLRLWLSDEGPGIAPEDLPHVFERFHRTPRGEDDHTGFGLGLAIVHAIADSHHGTAWVRSTTGAGSTFGIDVPVTVEGPPPMEDDATAPGHVPGHAAGAPTTTTAEEER
ncbi:sensor histidine kinase [Xylanimonas oleitrophica]|uniref:sensor histidine kinase n=1 Tax=Xylanimonas oleitrophica TaxID=2607479 RepID=UPI001C54ED60|nr:ATP-binding protein [Xylanimonas oleitrophica]